MRALTEYIATLKEGDTFKAFSNKRGKPIDTFVVKKVNKNTLQCEKLNFPDYGLKSFNKKTGQYRSQIFKEWAVTIYTIILPKEFVEKFM